MYLSCVAALPVPHIFPIPHQPHKVAFACIPGLAHARYKGEPDFIVGYDPETPFHDVAKAIEAHSSKRTGSSNETYWLECFAVNHHEPIVGPAQVRPKPGGFVLTF